MDFNFHMPTNVFFGHNCIERNAEILKPLGRKAILVTGKTSATACGAENDIKAELHAMDISFDIFNHVECNPSIENIRDGAAMAQKIMADIVIGIGGGSPLDAAKAIAVLATNPVDNDAVFSGNFSRPVLPIIAVPTTAGTGSEVTPYAILTDKTIENKHNMSCKAMFPAAAFLDPRYTASLSRDLTVHTALDALSHAVEGYLSKRATPLSDMHALNSIRIIGQQLPHLIQNPTIIDSTIRRQLMYASLLAGIVIAHTGTTVMHAMGNPLTYFKGIHHGRANGLLFSEYLKFAATANEVKVKTVLNRLQLETLERCDELMNQLLGGTETLDMVEIKAFSQTALHAKSTRNTYFSPTQETIERMYIKSFGLDAVSTSAKDS